MNDLRKAGDSVGNWI